MSKAMECVRKNSESYQDAALKYGVDRKALRKRVEGEISIDAKVGPSTLLSVKEEIKLVQHCLDMATLGYGYDVIQIRNIVRYHVKDQKITTGWWNRFQERHPEISRRRTEVLERQRASALSPSNFASFFETLKLAISKCEEMSGGEKITPARIFNMDEIGFDLNSIKGYVVTRKGVRNVPLVTSGNRIHVTVIACISAIG